MRVLQTIDFDLWWSFQCFLNTVNVELVSLVFCSLLFLSKLAPKQEASKVQICRAGYSSCKLVRWAVEWSGLVGEGGCLMAAVMLVGGGGVGGLGLPIAHQSST